MGVPVSAKKRPRVRQYLQQASPATLSLNVDVGAVGGLSSLRKKGPGLQSTKSSLAGLGSTLKTWDGGREFQCAAAGAFFSQTLESKIICSGS